LCPDGVARSRRSRIALGLDPIPQPQSFAHRLVDVHGNAIASGEFPEGRSATPKLSVAHNPSQLVFLAEYVHDIARSSAFYRDVLGWTQISTPDPRFPAAAFSSGRTHHELLLIEVGAEAQEVPSGRHVGLYHLGIKIGDSDDELREAVARCKEAGVRIVGLSDHTVSHRQHYVSCGKTDATS
jgi:catechol 2,3-dioxygenase